MPSLDSIQGGIRSALAGAVGAMADAGISAECAVVGQPQPPLPGMVIHAFEPSAPRLTRASAALRRWLRARAGDYSAIIAHTLWLSPTRYAIDAALAAGVPAMLVPHGMMDPDAMAHHRWRKRLRWVLGEARHVRRAMLLYSTQADAARSGRSVPGHTVPHGVVANPVEPQWFEPGRPRPAPRVLCLNRWHPRKGVLELVQALLALRARGVAFTAEFAGAVSDGAYARQVRQVAAPLIDAGLLRVHAILSPQQLRELAAPGGILVHPATGYENFGMVIAEGAAAGLAVVASPRALLTPEMARAGALTACEPTAGALAQTLAALLPDAARQTALGLAGQAYARQHFTFEQVGRQWLALLGTHAGGDSKL